MLPPTCLFDDVLDNPALIYTSYVSRMFTDANAYLHFFAFSSFFDFFFN